MGMRSNKRKEKKKGNKMALLLGFNTTKKSKTVKMPFLLFGNNPKCTDENYKYYHDIQMEIIVQCVVSNKLKIFPLIGVSTFGRD